MTHCAMGKTQKDLRNLLKHQLLLGTPHTGVQGHGYLLNHKNKKAKSTPTRDTAAGQRWSHLRLNHTMGGPIR